MNASVITLLSLRSLCLGVSVVISRPMPAAAQNPTGQRARHRPILQHRRTVDDHIEDSFAEMVWVLVRRHMADLLRIEDDHVRLHPRTQHAPAGKLGPIRGLAPSVEHGLLDGQAIITPTLVPHTACK